MKPFAASQPNECAGVGAVKSVKEVFVARSQWEPPKAFTAGPRKMAYSHQFVRSALGSSDEGRIDSSVYSLLKRFPFAGSICPPTTRNKNRHAFGGMHEAQRRGIPHLIERL